MLIDIDRLETLALKSVALKDPEYLYRKVCRYYSLNFHTPLAEVHTLPWPFVFTNYLEHIIETNNSKEDIYNLAIDICYPEKRVTEEDELNKRIKEIEAEEEEKRQKAKLDLETKKQEEDINMEPSSFSHLDKEMEEDS